MQRYVDPRFSLLFHDRCINAVPHGTYGFGIRAELCQHALQFVADRTVPFTIVPDGKDGPVEKLVEAPCPSADPYATFAILELELWMMFQAEGEQLE